MDTAVIMHSARRPRHHNHNDMQTRQLSPGLCKNCKLWDQDKARVVRNGDGGAECTIHYPYYPAAAQRLCVCVACLGRALRAVVSVSSSYKLPKILDDECPPGIVMHCIQLRFLTSISLRKYITI